VVYLPDKPKEAVIMTGQQIAQEMHEYLEEFKRKPEAERKMIAKRCLIRSGLMDENGEFTDHYAYSREYYRKKISV
jgi:hypothetical protein